MWCVYVCWQGAGDPDNAFIMFFHHEINHAPMAFSRTKFSRRRRRYIRLVARDVDRFARLISAPARSVVQCASDGLTSLSEYQAVAKKPMLVFVVRALLVGFWGRLEANL